MLIRNKLKLIEIEKVEPYGNLTGNDAVQLHDYLQNCIKDGRYCQIIDLKRVKEIDDIGANVFADFSNSPIYIALFNVKPEILENLIITGESENIKVFEESDCSKVVTFVEKDLLKKLTNPLTGKNHCENIKQMVAG